MIPAIKPTDKYTKITPKIKHKAILPLIAMPIVAYAYSASQRESIFATKIAQEKNSMGKPFTKNLEDHKKQLQKAGVKDSEISKYLNSSGNYNTEGEAILKKGKKQSTFKGSPDETSSETTSLNDTTDLQETQTLEESDVSISPEMTDIDDSLTDLPEIKAIDRTIQIVDTILDNPLLIGLAAEMLPVVRFLKPATDLFHGDFDKSLAGIISRGIDIVITPLKLTAGSVQGLVEAFSNSEPKNKIKTFYGGLKDFYTSWAQGRDDMEDEFLGRATKAEKLENLRVYKEELIKQKKQMLADRYKPKPEFADPIKPQAIIKENPLNNLDDRITAERKCFKELLEKLQALNPDMNLSEYNTYNTWGSSKLAKKARKIEEKIKAENDKKGIHEDFVPFSIKLKQIKTADLKNKFQNLLTEYQNCDPNAQISDYDGWENWNTDELKQNITALADIVDAAKRNPENTFFRFHHLPLRK